MFTIPKEAISYFDSFRFHHSGTFALLTASISLIAISKSVLTTWSLHQQANLQRQIESNRYRLELFNKRFDYIKEFQSKISIKDILSTDTNLWEAEKKIPYLDKNIEEINKAFLIFGNYPESGITKFLKITLDIKRIPSQISSIKYQIDCVSRDIIKYNNIIKSDISESELNELETKYEENINKISNLRVDLYNNERLYGSLCSSYKDSSLSCMRYMESKISFSDEPYVEGKSWLSPVWRCCFTSRQIHERIVICLVSVTCLLFLGVLLCS